MIWKSNQLTRVVELVGKTRNPMIDLRILAAVALTKGLIIAARDTSLSQAADLTVINPWE